LLGRGEATGPQHHRPHIRLRHRLHGTHHDIRRTTFGDLPPSAG
jgi:hypothetical protein